MFSRAHVIAALEAKTSAFAQHEAHNSREREVYEEALTWYADQSKGDVEKALAGIEKAGARPSTERVAGRSIVIPFEPRWTDHRAARTWAMHVLSGVPTLAVDGSQITPSPDFSIPVGAVQVGWFENRHTADETYIKDLCFEVLSPEELSAEAEDTRGFPDRLVNMRRFELECQVLTNSMRAQAGESPTPICFFDGSLIISFAAQMHPTLQRHYLDAVRSLIDTSEETRVPLVGYIDTSYARDLIAMLRWLRHDPKEPGISDGALLRPLMSWGDRTEALVCARDDGLFQKKTYPDYYERVFFVYIKTTNENAPARLDLPAWLLASDLLDDVLDVVRAECVVGTGYPYAIETADAVAVISMQDREKFYRVYQEFLGNLGLDLRYSHKSFSKRGRR